MDVLEFEKLLAEHKDDPELQEALLKLVKVKVNAAPPLLLNLLKRAADKEQDV